MATRLSKSAASGLIVLAVSITGCASNIDRVDLVYGSGTSYGLGVSTNPADPSGAGIILGMKRVDVAFVPVVVAKRCAAAGTANNNCSDDIYKLEKLAGGNTVAPTAEEAEKIAYAYKYDVIAKSYLEAAQADLAVRARIQNQGNTTDLVAEQGRTAVALQSAQQALTPYKNEPEKSKLVEAQAAVKKFESSKNDAFSVFGSFEGKGSATGGTSVTVSQSLGQMFSTGVASQNITEGFREMYKGIGQSKVEEAKRGCLGQVSSIYEKYAEVETDVTKKKEMLLILAQSCKPVVEANNK